MSKSFYSLLGALPLTLFLFTAVLPAQDKKSDAEKAADASSTDSVSVALPPKVSSTIKREAKNGKIVSVERQTEGDQIGYNFIITMNDKEYTAFVGTDGVLVEMVRLHDEEESQGDIELGKAPEAVQKAIANLNKGQKVARIHEDKHRTTYSFQVKEEAQVYDVAVDEQGQLLFKRKGEPREEEEKQ